MRINQSKTKFMIFNELGMINCTLATAVEVSVNVDAHIRFSRKTCSLCKPGL